MVLRPKRRHQSESHGRRRNQRRQIHPRENRGDVSGTVGCSNFIHEMTRIPTEPEAWLSREDAVCHADRIMRLEWLASILPTGEHLTFPGGLMSKLVFEEMRYCFAYGQFLATIVLGFAYIEHTLAAKFFAAGRNDLEHAGIRKLLREAHRHNILNDGEADELDRIRRTRNPVTHFRRPLTDDSIELRSLQENAHHYEVLEQDARAVVHATMKVLQKGVAEVL